MSSTLKKKSKKPSGADAAGPDSRFNFQKDARFKKGGEKQRKVKVDARFAKMFTAEEFQDGRKTDAIKNRMSEFYELEKGEDGEDADGEGEGDKSSKKTSTKTSTKDIKKSSKKNKKETLLPTEEDSSEDEAEDEKSTTDKKTTDPEEDPESDETDWSDSDEEEVDDSIWNTYDEQEEVQRTEEDTGSRLALQKLDWDLVSAEDIYVVCCSVLGETLGEEEDEKSVASKLAKKGGKDKKGSKKNDDDADDNKADNNSNKKIKSVKIYLSEQGDTAVEKEKVHGPAIFSEGKKDNGKKNNGKDNNGTEIDQEAIRKYAIEKSNYYFAVVECLDKKICAKLYEELDGNNIDALCDGRPLDARVIPDEIDLINDRPEHLREPTESCFKSTKNYKGVFESRMKSGLSHTKASCSWDERPERRKKDLMKKFTKSEMEKDDLQTYLASSSEEDDSEDEATIAEKRKLLLGGLEGVGGDGSDGEGDEDGEGFFESDEEEGKKKGDSNADSDNDDSDDEDMPDLENVSQDGSQDEAVSGDEGLSGDEEEEDSEEEEEEFLDDPDAVSEEEGNMEMTFDMDKEQKIKNAAEEISKKVKEQQEQQKQAQLKQTSNDSDNMDLLGNKQIKTTKSSWEKYQEKRKEKKKEQKMAIREKRNAIKEEVKKELEVLGKKKKGKKGGMKAGYLNTEEDGGEGEDGEVVERASVEELAEVMGDKKESRHFNLRGSSTSAKNTAAGGDGFVADVKDPRLARLFTDSNFAIDPTLPEFKSTAGMKEFLTEKRKREGGKRKKLKPQNTETKTAPSTVEAATTPSSTPSSGKRPAEDTEGGDDSVQLFKKKKKRKQA